MTKTILITGSTDGIGLETAKKFVSLGHTVLIHGRNPSKLENVANALAAEDGQVESYLADLSHMADVEAMAQAIAAKYSKLDILINNAGIFKTANPITDDGLDVRFVVNAIASYFLTQKLLPLMTTEGRIINLSSAAQATVNLKALAGQIKIADDFEAYAQSKTAITIWSHVLAQTNGNPIIIAVNPGSLLGSKMVKEGFGMAGKDIQIGVDILTRAALSEEFATASGKYFDNDSKRFVIAHADVENPQKSKEVVEAIETVLAKLTKSL
ncbi:short-chain dehydrogenase/reductase SDR [[Leptolyngbya] sp. PCC 7376]|uniref:SDR family NAD(P)-dependent oxidoreductase n=1 Tax=[Leptolyngbya] sp. PCC 7376 TaxID=111781 RepID=UPI00029ED636|nr:SDR family NAD(P)-dependent oxidoreductase [[Leptolyngbya] sp. PCC 7376]AFY36828.1 short-chain dehydrogenase/reductase SDR [[Leptolyngbya] sp. PCC 7376]